MKTFKANIKYKLILTFSINKLKNKMKITKTKAIFQSSTKTPKNHQIHTAEV